MNIFDVLDLVCGIALFLFGMNVMGDALKRSTGSNLKTILEKVTGNTFKAVLLGAVVTALIQSSSASTVMVVGFVNSGSMTLYQALGVIVGANVGTAMTSWLTGLSGLGEGGSAVVGAIQWLKPSSWVPILAIIGICLIMFVKRGKKKDIGMIFLGFSVLMVGMNMMSSSASGLQESESFRSILTMFHNPVLGVLAGIVLTAIVQSSSASIGILQSLTATGTITSGMAIPIIIGQNIGASVPVLISSIGSSKNGKRAAVSYLLFNLISAIILMTVFYILNAVLHFAFVEGTVNMWGVAAIHTIFKVVSAILISPFMKYFEKLVTACVRDKEGDDKADMLDERLLNTPSVAVAYSEQLTQEMAEMSCSAMKMSLELITEYDQKKADLIREYEGKADIYEDTLGTFLVKLSGREMNEKDSRKITKLLHLIGDFERISDHAVNIVESAEEMREKKLTFSDEATREIEVMRGAVTEILDLSYESFIKNDLKTAALVEPLEQVVDALKDRIKLNHVLRLQKNECTIEHGFVLSDLLTNFERVSDHCSNIAGCIIEISSHSALDMHKYLGEIKLDSEEFTKQFKLYRQKYAL